MPREKIELVTTAIEADQFEELIALDSAYLVHGAGLSPEDAPPPLTLKELDDAKQRGDKLRWIMSGTQRVGYYWTEMRPDSLFLSGIVVAAPLQNKGIGRQVLHWLDDQARLKGLSKCSLAVAPANAAALHVYLSHGYVVVADTPDYFGASCPGKRRFIMQKRCR